MLILLGLESGTFVNHKISVMFDRGKFCSQYSLLLRVSFIWYYFDFQVSVWFLMIESYSANILSWN